MKPIRNTAFFLLLLVVYTNREIVLHATVACNTVSITQCATGTATQNRYGKFCVWDGQNPVQSCSEFLADICQGYCDDDNPQTSPDYDPNAVQCPGPGGVSTCWCNGWQNCPEPEPPSCEEQCQNTADPEECICEECEDGEWIEPDDIPSYCYDPPTPIMIDLQKNRSQYHLTSPTDGVVFDIRARGTPEQVSWTRADSDVAFLVLDRNGNGLIDDGSELFGDSTLKSDGARARHGFDALVDLDGGVAASNGKIESTDGAYSSLRLWIDRNHNGHSEASELTSLQEAGVAAIFTEYTESRRRDRHGNWYRFEGSALIDVGARKERARRVFDVALVAQSR
jgi:hypothetical protein